MKDSPSALSLAIRVRNVGGGVVDGNSSRHARKDGHRRPYGEAVAMAGAMSGTCSGVAVINGDADAYGSSLPSRYTVPRSEMTCLISVAGRPSPGTQRRRIDSWKNRASAC